MRSLTLSHLPGRCPVCWVRLEHCICSLVPRVHTQTHVVFIRHEREGYKSTGTARIARLALPNSSLYEYGADPQEVERAIAHLAQPVLLYPAPPFTDWSPAPGGGSLVVLDGTWRQTRKMLRRLPSVQRLPRVALPPTAGGDSLRLRVGHFDGARSTLEAVAEALGAREGEAVSVPLQALHAAYVERVFRARGVWKHKQRTHSAAFGE